MCDSLFSDSSGLGLFFVLQLLLDIIDKQVPLTLKAGCFITQMVLWKMPFHLRMIIVASSLRFAFLCQWVSKLLNELINIQCLSCKRSHFSRVWLFALPGLWPSRLLCPWHSPGKSTGVSCHAPLQRIFPTQGSNPRLLMSPALEADFFTTTATWGALAMSIHH